MKKSKSYFGVWIVLTIIWLKGSPLFAESTVAPSAAEAGVQKVATGEEEKKKNSHLLIYFTHKDQDEVEELKPLLRPLSSKCAKCEISIISIVYRDSAIDLKDLQKKVSDIPNDTKIVVFDFNLKDTADTQFWAQQLRKIQEKGILIISSTGRALEAEIPMFLNKTVLGQNQKIILIGELSEKERMWPLSHFGPEILTALRLPDQYSGQDLAGLFVALRILPKIQQKTMDEWVTQLSEKKFKTKKIWLDLDEL